MKTIKRKASPASRRRKRFIMRFLKDYGVFHAWKCDVVDSPLSEDRKMMSAPQILELLSIENTNPIMNGMGWAASTYGEHFWCQCHMKWLDFRFRHIKDF